MGELIRFLVQYRLFFLFIALELISFWIIITQNDLQRNAYLSSSNAVVARIMQISNAVTNYFYLASENEKLAAENARLNQMLQQKAELITAYGLDTHNTAQLDPKFKYTVARVINNSVNKVNNYITLNKGLNDGIKPGMGVISPQGIVGRIVVSSPNYSTATSVLHTKMLISGKINRINAYGSIKWPGRDSRYVVLEYIARHLEPAVGDTVITSEYSTMIPEGIMIGIVKSIDLKPNSTFYDIVVELSTNFNALSYVYVIENKLSFEKDSLEKVTLSEFK